jgi:hypothetical protein
MKSLLPPLLPLLLLTACVNEGGSFQVDGPNHSIAVLREQAVFWNEEVAQQVVVARYPECQRRFELPAGVPKRIDIELYEARPTLYVMRAGKSWYALGTGLCVVQKFDTPPSTAPLKRLGKFDYNKESRFDFIPAP